MERERACDVGRTRLEIGEWTLQALWRDRTADT
jgi:hypothetical protein